MTEDGEQSPPGTQPASEVPETEAAEHTDSEASDREFPAEPIVAPPETDGEDEGKKFTATIREIERVPASEVPVGYPVSIDTAEALAVELTVDGSEKPVFLVYFETPERGPDDRFAKLSSLAGHPDSDPDNLLGESLLLTISDGYYMPVVPEESPRGNANAVYGVFAGLLPSLIIALVGLFSPGASFIATTQFVLAWVVATFLVLPVSLYFDAWNLRTTTGWGGTPRKWAAMAAVPGLNVLIVPLYLIARENAEPVV